VVLISILVKLSQSKLQNVCVFGSSGGLGQQICRTFVQKSVNVVAITRNIGNALEYPILNNLSNGKSKGKFEIRTADARDLKSLVSLGSSLAGTDCVVISVGTTAFPSSKWENGASNPEIACYQTVVNILDALTTLKWQKKEKKVILVSSVGVNRCDTFPYKLLNSYGVLDQKRKSEDLVLARAKSQGFCGIICRPGRLVGEPFTNFDLAKLLKIDQGKNQGIVFNKEDVVNGDVQRLDVAESITRIAGSTSLSSSSSIVYSIVNKKGPPPSEIEWSSLFSQL